MHLREYWFVARRHWWIVTLTTLAAVVTAYAIARSQQPTYRSSVTLEVTGRIDNGQVMAIEKLLRQIAARVTTTTVAETVSQRLRLDTGADALLGEIHTQSFPDTLHIQIDVDDADAARAERIAGAFAAVAQERQTAAMSAAPPDERVSLPALDRPTPGRLFAPQTRSLVLAGGLLGMLVGVILVFVIDYADERFHGASDVERSLGLRVVGVIDQDDRKGGA